MKFPWCRNFSQVQYSIKFSKAWTKFENFESFFAELESSRKNKWFLSYSHNPYKGNTKQRQSNVSKGLDKLNSKYDHIVFICDLNSELTFIRWILSHP